MKIKYLFLMISIINISAYADCGYELTTPVFSFGVSDVNPTTPGNVTVERSKASSSCNNFFLGFTKGWAGNYSRRALNLMNGDLIYYNIYKNANSTGVLKEPSDINSTNEVLFGTIARNQIKTLTYYFTLAPINAGSPPKSGSYIDVVQVQAYSGTYTNINAWEGYRDLYIFINVAKFVSLSLVDNGEIYDSSKTSKTLDFGELEEDEQLLFDTRIVSNAGYILKVSSANNGLLKRTGGSGVNSLISYDFFVNNSLKSLASSSGTPVTIASATGRTPSGGAQVPVRVKINSVNNKDPGTYQDFLTLSVISND